MCAATLALSSCAWLGLEPEPAAAPASPSPAAPSASPATDPSMEADPLADAVAALGCTGWEQSAEAAPFVDEWGTCDLDGVRLQVYLIPDEENYQAFMESVSGFGITEAQVVRAGSVLVAPDDQTKVDQIRQALA